MPKIKENLDDKKEEKLVKKKTTKKNVKESNKKAEKKTSKTSLKPKKVKEQKKTTKKVSTKTKKGTVKKKETTKKSQEKPIFLSEYYDLPYKYNETVVKILAQTPKRLFVYWEVSDKDKETYLNAFGEEFFKETYPVLLVHNEDMNYTFEVPINDFANSWYLDIKDTKSKYVVQLGRKFRNKAEAKPDKEIIKEEHINFQNDFVYITDSNRIETPNDHVLFEKLGNQVTYKNLKTGQEYKKDISSILEKLEKSYKDVNIEELYKELYGDEISGDILSNPSSGELTSSNFKAK